MSTDPNIGRVIGENELLDSGEFFEPPGTGQRIFPQYSVDGSVCLNPCIVIKIGRLLRTYEVEVRGVLFRDDATLTITRQIGDDRAH